MRAPWGPAGSFGVATTWQPRENRAMLLHEVVTTSTQVAETQSRLAKRDAIAALLSGAAPDDAALAVAYLSGRPRQRRTGVGWAALAAIPASAAEPTLTLAEVDAALDDLAGYAGSGSAAQRSARVTALFGAATEAEQGFLRGLISGELLQGAKESTVVEGLATAHGVPLAELRRAVMFAGGPVPVADALARRGAAALTEFPLSLGTPVQPMLASSAPDVAAALAKLTGPVLLDTKLDGIRLQAHKDGDSVRLFTRSLDDITERLPQVAALVRALPVSRAVLDGEVLALAADGRARPFQEIAAATAASATVAATVDNQPSNDADAPGAGLTPFFFDALLIDDRVLLDEPLSVRLAELERVVPAGHRTVGVRLDPAMPGQAERAASVFAEVVAAGQEGLVIKDLAAPYQAGRRGSGWVKVKPRHTLDLVVLAVERGNGRRAGTLSNIHLGARDGDGFVMLGKTFKGMTDAMLAWQTERFTELADGPTDGYVVRVRPEQVVEIAFDGVQRSTRYPGGVALRFARVLRYRDDKTADQADTLAAVRALALDAG